MIDYKKLAGDSIGNLVPYEPGMPIKELERKLGIKDVVKLASNENPLGLSAKVASAIGDALKDVNRYPIGNCYYLAQKLSEKLGVSVSKLTFGTGSNEIIELLMRAFLKDSEHVMSMAPSFSVYGLVAQAMGSECVWVPAKDDFSCDFDAIKATINDKTRIVFIANPNNPTGKYVTEAELVDFLNYVNEDVLIVMDEAYIEYVDAEDYPDTLNMLDRYPNLVLMRTFSKAYGLAGLRVGYAIAHEDCIDILNRVRQPFNVNMIAQVAAEAALDDERFLTDVVKANASNKDDMYSKLDGMGISYIPSQANFILMNVKDGRRVFDELLGKGIIVRYMGPKLSEYIRVTLGTSVENEKFLHALKEVMADI